MRSAVQVNGFLVSPFGKIFFVALTAVAFLVSIFKFSAPPMQEIAKLARARVGIYSLDRLRAGSFHGVFAPNAKLRR